MPIVALLALILPIGPVGWFLQRGGPPPRANTGPTLAQIATGAGCRLTEFEHGMKSNPPVGGRFRERFRAADGSYAGRRPPGLPATTHALFHGRVLLQYRPGLAGGELRALDRLVRKDTDKVLLFENQTGMPAPVAATAYLSVMTCRRVDGGTLAALAAFRDRRRAFGQAF